MKHDSALSAMRAAGTKESFLAAIHDVTANAAHLRIDRQALDRFADEFPVPTFVPGWHDYLSGSITKPDSPDYIAPLDARMKRAFHELALSCSINAGYTYKNARGETALWEKDGRDVAALIERLDEMWRRNIVPGVDIKDPAQARAALREIFNMVPAYAQERSEILSRFASEETRTIMANSMDRTATGPGTYTFDFAQVLELAKASPDGFGEDPFLKKAALVQIMVTGYAQSIGVDITLDTIIPADYRLPETLHNAGVLRLSDDLVDKIAAGHLFAQDDDEVTELRAAVVKCADYLEARIGRRLKDEANFRFQMHHLDGFLWFSSWFFEKDDPAALPEPQRKLRAGLEAIRNESAFSEPGFMKVVRKPIAVDTMRF